MCRRSEVSDGYDDEAFLADFTVHTAQCTWNGGWRPIQIAHVEGCMSEGPGCSNLICLTCKVKTFIISARGTRCHLHWTWHMHASVTVGDRTHRRALTNVNTTQTTGDKVWRRRFWERDGQKSWELMCNQETQGQPGLVLLHWSRWRVPPEAKGHTITQNEGWRQMTLLRVSRGGESDGGGRLMGRWEFQSAVVMPSAELSSILHQLSPLWGFPPSTKQVIWIYN